MPGQRGRIRTARPGRGRRIRAADDGLTWGEQTGLPVGGALLVRPDAHVAARSDADLAPAMLTTVLRTLTSDAAG